MVELVCELEQRKTLEAVPLPNYVIRSTTTDVSSKIFKNVTKETAASPFPFSIQLNKTTDMSQCSQLFVFVRYLHADASFVNCKGRRRFENDNSFAKQNFDLKQKLHTLCTHGAPAMLGNTSSFVTLVKEEGPPIVVTQ
jgi:hypothetical protein